MLDMCQSPIGMPSLLAQALISCLACALVASVA